jgi:hypothetical protein
MSTLPAKRVCREYGVSTPSTPIFNVHVSGDVLIFVSSGEEEKCVRVSSGVLTTTSEFFVDLFAANLRENQAPFSALSPKEVPMISDDPQAVLSLCNIIHHRGESTEVSNSKVLLDLATVCAKYDRVAAVRLWMSFQLDMQFRRLDEVVPSAGFHASEIFVADVMGLAYLFGRRGQFWRASKPLPATRHLSGSLQTYLPAALISEGPPMLLGNLTDHQGTDCLEQYRNTMIESITYNADTAIAEALTKASSSSTSLTFTGLDDNGARKRACANAVRKVGFFMGCLKSVELWPLRNDRRALPSVKEILETLTAVSRAKPPAKCSKIQCEACSYDIAHKLKEVADIHKKKLTGLCLGCIREAKYSSDSFRKSFHIMASHGTLVHISRLAESAARA